MGKLIVFNNQSLDGYFVDGDGGLGWARHSPKDREWDAFVSGNVGGEGVLLFGRITYELMAGYWPTPLAARDNPLVAEGMNGHEKVVFSRTLDKVSWANTRLVKGDPVAEVRKLKGEKGPGMVVLGSGTLVSQLAPEGLIDEYQFVVIPVILGKGRTMFEGGREKRSLKRTRTRSFHNGNVLLVYQPES